MTPTRTADIVSRLSIRLVLLSEAKRADRISRWLVQLKERVGWQKTVVALANKNARILRAVLTRDATFDPDHVPMPPAARGGLRLQAAA